MLLDTWKVFCVCVWGEGGEVEVCQSKRFLLYKSVYVETGEILAYKCRVSVHLFSLSILLHGYCSTCFGDEGRRLGKVPRYNANLLCTFMIKDCFQLYTSENWDILKYFCTFSK